MNRRDLLVGLLTAAAGAGTVAASRAQTRGLPRVVAVTIRDEERYRSLNEGFLAGMTALGHGQDLTYRLEILYGNLEQTRVAALIREAVAGNPDVIMVSGLTNAKRAKEASSTIPVVVALASDLVDAGVIASFSRPGGNVTGITDQADELAEKRLELLLEAYPGARRVALVNNPDFPATPKIEERVRATALQHGVTIISLLARDRVSLHQIIQSLGKLKPDALLPGGDGLFAANARELIEGARAQGVPVVHYWPGTAEMGALLSYHVDARKAYERAAYYVDRILKGARASELPVERPARYELVVSRSAAKAFGVTFPPAIALRADRIVD